MNISVFKIPADDGYLTDCFVLLCRSFLFSAGILYEVDKLSGMILARSESKARRY
jgi:hypothetical protein